jgi:hypothetical protein
VISRPEGKASKGMMDIWIGKNSMRRIGGRTIVLYSITHSMITKRVPEPGIDSNNMEISSCIRCGLKIYQCIPIKNGAVQYFASILMSLAFSIVYTLKAWKKAKAD